MFKSMFEDISPTTEYIRIDVRNKFINEFNLTDRDDIQLLDNILQHHFPNDKVVCDLSWRGYITFEINKSIMYALKPEFNALKVLRKHLTPIIIHRLYRYPDGLRFCELRDKYEYKCFTPMKI